ncbi:MAG: GTPase HflX [Patescibacteria group bacterium]
MLRAILIDVVHYTVSRAEAEVRLAELSELTRTYGGLVVVEVFQRRAAPDQNTYIGSGKVETLFETWPTHRAEVLIINGFLKPGVMDRLQEKFKPLKMEVWDRYDLILNIFEKHATTVEAKLQIELAKIRHLGPRMVGMSEQLGRQRGGTGTRGGAGEGNTEVMKRHWKEQERRIATKLEQLEQGRNLQRQNRRRQEIVTVALVGYTNAGKTSVLNKLTKKKELSANRLFATLDTRLGEWFIEGSPKKILISDTIGFIQDLPPALIKAFKSTLSEAIQADLLLLVIDGADHRLIEKLAVVEAILASLVPTNQPRLLLYNKSDLPNFTILADRPGIGFSTITGIGTDTLEQQVRALLFPSARL